MIEFTEDEKKFLLSALTTGMQLGGTYAQLVPVMNMIESIVQKLQRPEGAPVPPQATLDTPKES